MQRFSCARNKEVEGFLHNNATRFEKDHIGRTYFVVNADSNDDISIHAYFTLTFREIELKDGNDVPKTQVQKMDGINKNAKSIKAYLIGQLARNHEITPKMVNLSLILQHVYDVLRDAQRLVGGRVVFLECDDNQKIVDQYKENGFAYLQKTKDDNQIQMYRLLDD